MRSFFKDCRVSNRPFQFRLLNILENAPRPKFDLKHLEGHSFSQLTMELLQRFAEKREYAYGMLGLRKTLCPNADRKDFDWFFTHAAVPKFTAETRRELEAAVRLIYAHSDYKYSVFLNDINKLINDLIREVLLQEIPSQPFDGHAVEHMPADIRHRTLPLNLVDSNGLLILPQEISMGALRNTCLYRPHSPIVDLDRFEVELVRALENCKRRAKYENRKK